MVQPTKGSGVPILVLGFFAAVVLWAVMLAAAFRTSQYRYFIFIGIGLMLVLNVGYFVNGQADAIAYFISLYDVLINVGISGTDDLPAALATCAGNECTLWGDTYEAHSSWGVAFNERFADGPGGRKALLFSHIGFNTVAFVLGHVQLAKPGRLGAAGRNHRWLGRVTFASVTLGTLSAVWLATQHTTVEEYGGTLSTLGFFSMAFVVFGAAVKTVTTARSGDIAAHRIWMFRWLGSMWGAYWLFRVILFTFDPLLRGIEGAAFLISTWFSAPLGMAIAEWFRTRRSTVDVRSTEAPTPAGV